MIRTCTFRNPFLALTNEETAHKAPGKRNSPIIPKSEVLEAAHAAWAELATYEKRYPQKGRRNPSLYGRRPARRGIVLAGRPYHIDPEINHGIPELINSYGIAVLTEDSVVSSGTSWSVR